MNTQKKPEDEIKFRELLKDPIRLFGWIFPMFLVLILAVGIFFVKHLTEVSYNSQSIGLQDSTLLKKDVEMKKGGVLTAVDLNLVKAPTPEFISKGKELYDSNCKSCHGDKGLGDGPAGLALVKKPRNLVAPEGWTNGRDIDQLYKTLQEGIIKNGMASYEYLSSTDRFAIISFLRTLTTYPPVTDDQLKSMDAAYNLSAGSSIPNKIPVSLAEMKLINESRSKSELFLKFENKFNTSTDDPANKLLKKSASDYRKVFYSFINSNVKENLNNFVADVISNPVNAGFKPLVVQYTMEEWKRIYDYLKTATM
ncbi:MAG: hypothetical protein CVV24_12855 [Ignavibacteriae bacterium HGW-Ignavibacteriae-3]|nr:MAG: hypothetical protein CVV24_12855 [Ignavibacteriae bacterium HGW-Ignavibacteriae-3]